MGTSLAIAMPSFWVALLLVTVFAVQLHWLPPFGYVPFGESPVEWFRHLILPATALALTTLAVLSRQLRAGLADTMDSAFVRTGWAKGGNTRQVVAGHALKTSAIPAVTVLGLQIGGILAGAVIIEQIFSLPGLGTYLLGAVDKRDIPVILATALLLVVINMVASLGRRHHLRLPQPQGAARREPVAAQPGADPADLGDATAASPLAMTALILLVIIALCGIFYELIAPYDPEELLDGPAVRRAFLGAPGRHRRPRSRRVQPAAPGRRRQHAVQPHRRVDRARDRGAARPVLRLSRRQVRRRSSCG